MSYLHCIEIVNEVQQVTSIILLVSFIVVITYPIVVGFLWPNDALGAFTDYRFVRIAVVFLVISTVTVICLNSLTLLLVRKQLKEFTHSSEKIGVTINDHIDSSFDINQLQKIEKMDFFEVPKGDLGTKLTVSLTVKEASYLLHAVRSQSVPTKYYIYSNLSKASEWDLIGKLYTNQLDAYQP